MLNDFNKLHEEFGPKNKFDRGSWIFASNDEIVTSKYYLAYISNGSYPNLFNYFLRRILQMIWDMNILQRKVNGCGDITKHHHLTARGRPLGASSAWNMDT
jgi:hypothetical protein